MTRILVLLVPTMLWLTACTSERESARSTPTAAKPAPDTTPGVPPAAAQSSSATVIVVLETRNHKVHLVAGNRYTIEDADGKQLASNLTDREFADRFPDLHRATKEALATGDSGEVDFGASRAD